MSGRKALVKQADLTRMVKGAQAAGVAVGEVRIEPDGTVRIIPASVAPQLGANPCDRLLDP
jgi:hypothetical protein